jgi:hypothetical protein
MRGRRAIARWQNGKRRLEAKHYLTGNQQFADTAMTIERGNDDRRNDREQPGDEAAKPTGGDSARESPPDETWPASVAVTAEFWPAAGSARAKTVLAIGTPISGTIRRYASWISATAGSPRALNVAAVTIRIAAFTNSAIIGAIAESKVADRMTSPFPRVVRGASRVCTIDE